MFPSTRCLCVAHHPSAQASIFCPAVCLLVPGSVVVAILISRLAHFRWAVWLGWGVTVVACGVFTLFDERTEKAVFALALAVFSVGNGMVLTSVNVATQAIAAQTIAKEEDRAIAACIYGFMRSLGMPTGIAVRSVPKAAGSRSASLHVTSC